MEKTVDENVKFAHDALKYVRDKNPDMIIILETPEGTVQCRLGDALIYIGMRGELVIDSE